jgi:hypothetical protein
MYCCEQCRLTHKRENDKEYYSKRREYVKERRLQKISQDEEEEKHRAGKTSLYELDRRARMAGLSYGKYIAMLRLQNIRNSSSGEVTIR